ncbi:MAG: hypothetical protein ACI8WT_005118 [Clostridium sp.]
MGSIIIPATKSLTVTNKLPNGNINNDSIIIGNDGVDKYISYLFFDISAIPNDVCILSAELVLFKMNEFYNDFKKEFSVYPLRDYFSSYTTFNNRPRVVTTMKRNFYPITTNVAVTVNLTYYISLWLKNKLTNTGISIITKSNNTFAEFGSSICKDSYLVPFIKVVTGNECNSEKPDCNQGGASIRKVRVIGTVAEGSQYSSVVNVGINRKGTGHIDDYYVADEYDNLSGGSPLHVDKIYNIAITPKKKPDDVENIELYGSYKG